MFTRKNVGTCKNCSCRIIIYVGNKKNENSLDTSNVNW